MTISPAIASMRRLLGDDAVDEWLHQHRFAHKERELMQRIAELEAALRECREAVKYTGSQESVTLIVNNAIGSDDDGS